MALLNTKQYVIINCTVNFFPKNDQDGSQEKLTLYLLCNPSDLIIFLNNSVLCSFKWAPTQESISASCGSIEFKIFLQIEIIKVLRKNIFYCVSSKLYLVSQNLTY